RRSAGGPPSDDHLVQIGKRLVEAVARQRIGEEEGLAAGLQPIGTFGVSATATTSSEAPSCALPWVAVSRRSARGGIPPRARSRGPCAGEQGSRGTWATA